MTEPHTTARDLAALVIPQQGHLQETDNPWESYQLVDPMGQVVEPVAAYFRELQGASSPATTIRSYGNDLLRWFRFLWAIDIPWNKATRTDARDFARWLQMADKPARVHWRRKGDSEAGAVPLPPRRSDRAEPGSPNPATGKRSPGRKYAASTRAHCETVVRIFYDFHLENGSGPIINPFPLHRSRKSGRAHAHSNPMQEQRNERQGRYRPKVPKQLPRRIPDEKFNEIFTGLKSNRDRALLAFWVSTGARSEELLSSLHRDADPGQQLIGVIRKGSREHQQLPASADAFVWLRLYQEEARRAGVPCGRKDYLWWTLRRPWRPLNYPAARAMFNRANELAGTNWTLHDLRHTAAYRMAQDPAISLTDVQWVLGHAKLTTTQIYLSPSRDEVIENVIAHHARQARKLAEPAPPPPGPGYNPASLDILFGRS